MSDRSVPESARKGGAIAGESAEHNSNSTRQPPLTKEQLGLMTLGGFGTCLLTVVSQLALILYSHHPLAAWLAIAILAVIIGVIVSWLTGAGRVLSGWMRRLRDRASPDQASATASPVTEAAKKPQGAKHERTHFLADGMAGGAVIGAMLGVGYGLRLAFAHGTAWGPLACACVAGAIGIVLIAVRHRPIPDSLHMPRGWIGWTFEGLLGVAALSWGLALGHGTLPVLCPIPTELRVLTSTEDFAAIKNAIPYFEQSTTVGRSGCEAVDVTAYASPSMQYAQIAFAKWQQEEQKGSAPVPDPKVGPPPDVWVPDSTSVIPAGEPTFDNLGIIGYSPVVIAVPGKVAKSSWQSESWAQVYQALHDLGMSLALPDPNTSEAGLIGLSELYRPPAAGDARMIESAGSFPQDSESLLCAAGQAAGEGITPETAYLVSEAAVADYDQHQLSGAACGAAGSAAVVAGLTPVFPAPGVAMEFPFVQVKWPADQSPAAVKEAYAFYRWLRGPDRYALGYGGVRAFDCKTGGTVNAEPQSSYGDGSCLYPAQLTSLAAQTRAVFNQARIPAQVVIGIDDSGPMTPYLPQIAAAIDSDVPGSVSYPQDRFAIWELPGTGQQTWTALVSLRQATAANRMQVPDRIGTFHGDGHSHNYDVLASAAATLYADDTAPQPANSVVLLTDGDGGSQYQTPVDVERKFLYPPAGRKPIKLFIIAFGPAGCTPAMFQLANTTGGTCDAAGQSDPGLRLKEILSQLTGWR